MCVNKIQPRIIVNQDVKNMHGGVKKSWNKKIQSTDIIIKNIKNLI